MPPPVLPRELAAAPEQALQRPCPVCDAAEGVVLGSLRYALIEGTNVAAEFDVVCCRQCGFVVGNTPTTQEEFESFYRGYTYSPAYRSQPIDDEERNYWTDVADTVLRYARRDRLGIFDVGCGNGHFLKVFRSLNPRPLYAIDLSSDCVNQLRSDGFAGAVGSASRLPFAFVSPGAIVMAHILEHIVDLTSTVDHLRERVRDAGPLYVEVPDTSRFAEFGIPLRYFYPQHVVHFDAHQLDNLFHSHGFRSRARGVRIRREKELVLPSIWSVYESVPQESEAVAANFELARTIAGWFQTHSLDPDGIYAELAEHGCRVYVWGVGIHVQMMLGMSPLADCNIVCCVDQNPQLQGKRVGTFLIDSTERLSEATASDVVVVGSHIHRTSMTKTLRDEIGFQGNIVTI